MSSFYSHAVSSATEWGGVPSDYLEIHKFLDSSKNHLPSISHRAALHHTFGIEVAVLLFGDILVNSDGNHVLVRDIAARHIMEDCGGRVPTLQDWLGDITLKPFAMAAKPMGEEDPNVMYLVLPASVDYNDEYYYQSGEGDAWDINGAIECFTLAEVAEAKIKLMGQLASDYDFDGTDLKDLVTVKKITRKGT